jgi:DNA-binding protein H-NS
LSIREHGKTLPFTEWRRAVARIAVEKMTLKQIEGLEAQIAAAKTKAAEMAKAELKAKIDALLAGSEFTIGDLYPMLGRGKKRSKSAAKYANPEDRSQTYTGRGRRPKWLEARLKKGAKLDDFAI